MSDVYWTSIRRPKNFETTNDVSLRKRIEGDDLDKCQDAIEELLQTQLDGEKFPTNLIMPVVNRYQMNKFHGKEIQDKRIKKLLYLLWEFLPKRGPDGKFLDKILMVCGAFDRDLKHPNPFVTGSVLRALSKTREPEVIGELVHSIEKCLDLPHSYPRKNAALAISAIYKNFPDLIPSAPKLLSEHLAKEADDDCKRALLQALIQIDPQEAKGYLQSCNIIDIHSMNPAIQLRFIELIEKIYQKGSDDCRVYLRILSTLIKSSSSPSVRYQAARVLPKFSREAEYIKSAAACFIDICAKESDNNAKIVILDDLIRLRRIKGAERVLRDSIMDILIILQSAKDLELHERILRLTLDLVSPLNIGGVVLTLRQEMLKMQDVNTFGTPQEALKYRELLVDTVHQIATRFPKAMVEYEMLDTLFDLLQCNTIGERTSKRLIYLFKVFMLNNEDYRGLLIRKIQENFNLIRDSQYTHRGLIQVLGDFSKSKPEIEKSCKIIEESLGEISIVESELRKIKLAQEGQGDETEPDSNNKKKDPNDVDASIKAVSRLVTADGSYAKQSAINYHTTTTTGEDHPPLRSYYLKNKFETLTVLCFALCKMSFRYKEVEPARATQNKLNARFLMIIAAIGRLNESPLIHSENNLRINKDQELVMKLALKILQIDDHDKDAELIRRILTKDMPAKLATVVKNLELDRLETDIHGKLKKNGLRFDDEVKISLFANQNDDSRIDNDDQGDSDADDDDTDLTQPSMFKEIPLTGTIDPIYAYCEVDVNQYDIVLTVHLENRTKSTFENVTLELSSRGEGFTNFIERPDAVVLAPRSSARLRTTVKILSAENRRLVGCITYVDVAADNREQFITINDIVINITDYIKPATIGYEDFCDVWRDCEWENKVNVKTKHTNLKEYLSHLVRSTRMYCVTPERSLDGDCFFLTANLYAKSSFGEESLVNVSIQKESPASTSSLVTGNVKIRSRSQGMALSLGEKIQSVQ